MQLYLRTWIELMALIAAAYGFMGPAVADERTKTFPDHKCRYTLPAPDWTWSNKQVPNALFIATNPKGTTLFLSVASLPSEVQLDEKFLQGFEKSFFQPGRIDRRGGHKTTFHGVPAFQYEVLTSEKKTGVVRLFICNKFSYQLSVIGGKEPIEQDPSFETIMQGFEFTSPPEPSSPSGQQSKDGASGITSFGLGKIVGSAIIFGIVVGVIGAAVHFASRKMRSRKNDAG